MHVSSNTIHLFHFLDADGTTSIHSIISIDEVRLHHQLKAL